MLPLAVTFNRILANIKIIIRNHWFILKTNKALEKIFSVEPIIVFRKDKTPKQLIGGNTIQNDKNVKKNQATNMKGNVHLVNLEYGHCIVHMYKTHIYFVANKMGRYLKFYAKSIAKMILSSSFRMQGKKCHIQYVGKAVTDFNLILNNHCKGVYKADAIQPLRHFAISLIQRQVLL